MGRPVGVAAAAAAAAGRDDIWHSVFSRAPACTIAGAFRLGSHRSNPIGRVSDGPPCLVIEYPEDL